MKTIKSSKGQALILIAFAVVGLVGFTALAIDGGRVFSDRRHAQNAADTAAFAAALAKIRTPGDDEALKNANAEEAALTRAESNGYENDGDNIVEVHFCDEPNLDPPCEGMVTGADESEYIQVVIRLTTPTTFARVLGRDAVDSVVSAISRVQGSLSEESFFSDAAMLATKGGPYDQCFLVTGGGTIYTHNSGVYVNCEGGSALFMNGGGSLEMDAPGEVVGCNSGNGGATFDPITCGVNGGVSESINASTFAGVPTTQPPPTCNAPAPPKVGNEYSPGAYSNLIISGTATMKPGAYCVSGNFTVTSATLNGPAGGRVQIVLQDQTINMTSGSTLDFDDLEIYGRDASFRLLGGAVFRADRLRYFSTGAGEIDVAGGAELNSGDAYFYLHRGDIRWNGNSIIRLHGPPQGDTYGGLLIHKPWANNVPMTLNGGANIQLTGTFMAPGSQVTYNGNVDFELHSQIIASEFKITGGGDLDIFYDPSENYTPPNSPSIEFTK